ncbi:MAG: hypothetical protein HY814_12855 [Candidatus Riflebacteria bacterium]|nr:hypothetical protein [Candidatus Riflebacteria bacterium]
MAGPWYTAGTMRILAIDIGTGTRDLLLYDSDKRLENCVQMILPSNSKVMAKRIEGLSGDLYLTGRTVGGGPMVRALRHHLQKGYRVAFSPEAAFTVKNELSKVRSRGIEVSSQPRGTVLELDEIDLAGLQVFLASLEEALRPGDGIAIAVQDHGNAPADQSDRDFRWRQFAASLEADPRLSPLVFPKERIPDCFYRMRSVATYLEERLPGSPLVVSDTCVAALLGCLSPRGGYAPAPGEIDLVMNLGNSHTMAAILRDGEVLAILEHHTYELEDRLPNLPRFLGQLADGSIDSAEVMADEGEGAIVREAVGTAAIRRFLVTGPRRHLAAELPFPFACSPQFVAPAGNMMITGCLGLVDGFYHHLVDAPTPVTMT